MGPDDQPHHLNPKFYLSSKGLDLKCNFFVWIERRIELALSVHENSHITYRTLYRWMDMVHQQNDRADYGTVCTYLLRRISIQPVAKECFLEFLNIPEGSYIPRDSNELIVPGHYSTFESEEPRELFHLHIPSPGFPMSEEQIFEEPAFANLQFYSAILDRDQKTCVITGLREPDPVATWILYNFRHNWVTELSYDEIDLNPLKLPQQDLVVHTPRNGLTMHPRLAELWRRNVFSIDPEDDYRIVWFRDPRTVCAPELLSHIPTHLRLPSVPEELRPNYWALRGHLKESLFDNVTDCDIHSDFDFADLSAIWDQAFGDDPCEVPAPLTDPVWQTRLGQILFEWIMATDSRLHEREETRESASAQEAVDTSGQE